MLLSRVQRHSCFRFLIRDIHQRNYIQILVMNWDSLLYSNEIELPLKFSQMFSLTKQSSMNDNDSTPTPLVPILIVLFNDCTKENENISKYVMNLNIESLRI